MLCLVEKRAILIKSKGDVTMELSNKEIKSILKETHSVQAVTRVEATLRRDPNADIDEILRPWVH